VEAHLDPQQRTHPSQVRAGHHDPVERSEDIDTDRVDIEVLYCEDSANAARVGDI
jgi:hypothetical protein